MKKLKIINPFKLMNDIFPAKEKEPVYEIEVEKEKKQKVKKKRGDVDLDFEFKELGFEFNYQSGDVSIYNYVSIPDIYLFWNKAENYISLSLGKILLSKVNFIPNNRLFIEMLIKKTIENIK